MDEQRSKIVTETFVLLYKDRRLHRRNPNSRALDVYEEAEELLEEEPHAEFSDEVPSPTSFIAGICVQEGHGRYFSDYSPTTFSRSWLSCNYVNFWMVTGSIGFNITLLYSAVETEFEDISEDGKIQGWESKGGNISSQDSIIDFDYYITVHELMDMDKDILKEMSRRISARMGRHENSLDTENFYNPGA